MPQVSAALRKVPTGIDGLDALTGGGLPQGRATLVEGPAGSGKTVLALQTLVNGARRWKAPGVFVTFEEDSERVFANAASFGWDLPALSKRSLFFVDAQPSPDMVVSGTFDLSGLLATLGARVRSMRAQRVVFDSLDVVLSLLDPQERRRELVRLHQWLHAHDLTGILTGKADPAGGQPTDGTQYLVDCCLKLDHRTDFGVSHRSLRVVKFRGSSFGENETPMVIGDRGVLVAAGRGPAARERVASAERVSLGTAALDSMVGDGCHRGSSVLVTGAPGTAKTTLAGFFAQAACARGEPTLFVSFDSEPAELVRNLASVGIALRRPRQKGMLHIEGVHAADSSAEQSALHIRLLAERMQARCLVVDPISALAKQGNTATAFGAIERLTRWGRDSGVTLFCTSLLDGQTPELESTPVQISTIADTWIHLSYRVGAGERNRTLTIVKSRGTAHSNQVRELVLTSDGMRITDVYTAGGEVLLGTLRWEKEQAAVGEVERRRQEAVRRRAQLDAEEAALMARLRALEVELAAKQGERRVLDQGEEGDRLREVLHREAIRRVRSSGER